MKINNKDLKQIIKEEFQLELKKRTIKKRILEIKNKLKHIELFESVVNKGDIVVYHGSNNKFNDFKLVRQENIKSSVGWFTDSYDYAHSQGMYVDKFILKPNKILNTETLNKLSDDDIINAILTYAPNLKPSKISNRILPKVRKRITEYNNNELIGYEIFKGLGDVEILSLLGFDMEITKSPYDKSDEESHFHIVYNDKIINRIN